LIADGEVDERDVSISRRRICSGLYQCHFFAGIGGWSLALRLAGYRTSDLSDGRALPAFQFGRQGR